MKRAYSRTRTILAAVSLLTSIPALAQPNLLPEADTSEPRAVFERFRSISDQRQLDGAAGRALLGGELAEVNAPTFGSLDAPDRVLRIGPNTSVIRVPASPNRLLDRYFFLTRDRDGTWKITAVRHLALSRVSQLLRDQLRALENRSPEQEQTLRNLDLTLHSDRELGRWFNAHSAELETLRQLAAVATAHSRVDSPAVRDLLARMGALTAEVERDGLVRVTIGGILDNTVGFLHVTDQRLVPPIDPSGHIWIEPVGDGWYLFRTT